MSAETLSDTIYGGGLGHEVESANSDRPKALTPYTYTHQAAQLSVLVSKRYIPLSLVTGELIGYSQSSRSHVVQKYQGQDTVYPAKARTAESLANAIAVHDQWKDSLIFYPDRLLSLLDSGLTSSAVRVLRTLCESLAGRNVWFGTLVDVRLGLDIAERTFNRAVAELSAAHLIVVDRLGQGQDTRVRVHPWYAFKGDRCLLDQYLAAWVREPKSSGGVA